MGIKKSLLAIGAVLGTLVAGVLAYNYNPNVKEFVDNNLLNNIINTNSGTTQNNNSEDWTQLSQTENIVFDEKTRTLTFDAVDNAVQYFVQITNENLNKTYSYRVETNSVEVDIPTGTLTGHTMEFAVTSVADYVTHYNSLPLTYDYVMQYQSEKIYTNVEDNLYNSIQYNLNDFVYMGGTRNIEINAINYENNNVTIIGTADNRYYENFQYTLTFDISNYATSEYSDISDLSNLINFSSMCSRVSGVTSVTYDIDYTANITNFSDRILASNSDTITSYINQGYTVACLQQNNSEITIPAENVRAFTVDGLYTATKDGNTVTFTMQNEVRMNANSEFTTDQEYFDFYNQTGNGTVTDKNMEVCNADAMYHLGIINEIHNSQTTTATATTTAKTTQQSNYEFEF